MTFFSIKTKVLLAAIVLLIFGAIGAGFISYKVMDETLERNQAQNLENTSQHALETIKLLQARMAFLSAIFSRSPDISEALAQGNRQKLETRLKSELAKLKENDPVISVIEITDAKGVIVIRGHNPAKFGDNKSKLKEVQQALSGKEALFLEVSPSSGELALGGINPIFDNGQIIGTLKFGARFTPQIAQEIKAKTGLDVGFFAKDKVLASTIHSDHILELFKNKPSEEGLNNPVVPVGPQQYRLDFRTIPTDQGQPIEMVSLLNIEPSQKIKNHLLISQSYGIAVLIGFLTLLVAFAAHQAVKPLASLSKNLGSLAKGQLDVQIGFEKRKDEIGQVAQSVENMRQSLLRSYGVENESRRVETGMIAERQNVLVRLTQELENNVGQAITTMLTSVVSLQNNTKMMDDTVILTQNHVQVAFHASDASTQNVQLVGAAAEQLTSSIAEIDRQVNNGTHVTSEAALQVQQTRELVSILDKSGHKIGEVVTLINDIAEQTNLLALNATIEAARAGEAGRGFAVVAQEVKNLASQTAKATEDISEQINSMQAANGKAISAICGISDTMKQLEDVSRTIAYAVKEQMSATQEIVRSISETVDNTEHARSSLKTVQDATKRTASSAQSVVIEVESLNNQAQEMQEAMKTTLQAMRAA